jgi:hypothetical protein
LCRLSLACSLSFTIVIAVGVAVNPIKAAATITVTNVITLSDVATSTVTLRIVYAIWLPLILR